MNSIDKVVIDFDIWFSKHIMRVPDCRNFKLTVSKLGGHDKERIKYIVDKFPSTRVCPTCEGLGYLQGDVANLSKKDSLQ